MKTEMPHITFKQDLLQTVFTKSSFFSSIIENDLTAKSETMWR